MSPEVKAKWIEALRSGRYRQCIGRMSRLDAKGCSYCALGVLRVIGGRREEVLLRPDLRDYIINLNDRLKLSFEEIADSLEDLL